MTYTDCPIIDACEITPSKEFYYHYCRQHYNRCERFKTADTIRRLGTGELTLESLGEEPVCMCEQEQLNMFVPYSAFPETKVRTVFEHE